MDGSGRTVALPVTLWAVRMGFVQMAAGLLAVLLVAGCTGTPPVPVVGTAELTPSRTVEPGASQLIVGVDDLGSGFNPHTLADFSPTTRALATLVLPSVFRPAPDGALELDPTVALSAKVSSDAPFTVSYELTKEASWSDNAPIAAEDFVYLWQQMRSQPGVVDAAGYQLITDVHSRAGGKTVEVVFDRTYPAWRTLFRDLLPAHLLKDAPGAWNGALNDAIPVSGGPFTVSQVDRNREQITLVRNDRYWAVPAVADRILIQAADPTALVDRLRSGDTRVVQMRADTVTLAQLAGLGATVVVRMVPQPEVAQLVLDTVGGPLADQDVRVAVAASIDRDALITLGTGAGPSAQLRADAHVLAPSVPDFRSTLPAGVPATPDPALAARLLTAAGYSRGTDGGWQRAGVPLLITVAAAAGEQPFLTVADALVRQLVTAGFAARTTAPSGDALFTRDPAAPAETPAPSAPATPDDSQPLQVDIAVVPHPVGGDPANQLASTYGCPRQTGASPPVRSAPSNLSGFCDPSLQGLVEGALSGTLTTQSVLTLAEPALWTELPTIPLFQLSTVLVTQVGTEVGVGPLLTGPLTGAQHWAPPLR